MKYYAMIGLLFTFSLPAFSMPCDTGYNCISKTGKYNILLQRCLYRNHLNFLSLQINGVDIADATLTEGWDGDNALAFEINIPTPISGAVRILSADLSARYKTGLIREKTAASEPGPLTTIHTEGITCKVAE
jgi:hypothetical protein